MAARYSSLAFDRAGFPAIAYCDDLDHNGMIDTLKLARWNGSAWKTEVVDSGVSGYGVFASLAFDASGNPAMAHGNGTVRYVYWNGSTWVPEVVGSGYAPSLAFDGTGPLISYRAGSNGLRLARRSGDGTWTTELVETVSASWTTHLVLDPQGSPSFSYRRYAELRCADRFRPVAYAVKWTQPRGTPGDSASRGLGTRPPAGPRGPGGRSDRRANPTSSSGSSYREIRGGNTFYVSEPGFR